MNAALARIGLGIPRLMRSPRRFLRLVWSRLLPVRAILKDPLAYHSVGNWTFGKLPRVDITRVFPTIDLAEVVLLRALGANAETSLTVQELAVLCAIVRFAKAKHILEVGTYDGRTTLNLAANASAGARVTTIDLPVEWNHQLALEVPRHLINATAIPEAMLAYRDTPHAGRIRQVYADSAALDWRSLGVPFDLVFLDGCHYYEYAKSDTNNALTSLRSGGFLIWHDYGMIEDVSRVVDETAARMTVQAIRSTSLAVGFAD